MKKFLIFISMVFIYFSAFGQIRNVSEFRQKKISFYCEPNYSKVVNNIDSELSLIESYKSDYSTEMYLTLKNALIVDKLFFSLENGELPKSKKGYFKTLMLDQEEVCEKYMKGKSYSQLSGDFLATLGDLKCQMPFVISIPAAIPKLTKSKTLYENAVINSPKSCACLISKALWYEYSPAITGGSHKKAYEIIQQAESVATTSGDMFFALVFKGQILVSLKKNNEALTVFKTAHNLFPKETFTNHIEEKLDFNMNF